MKLPEILKVISKELQMVGAKAIIVGGAVRDYFLKLPVKDYDIEVYGLKSIKELEIILNRYGSINFVGKSFGVLKLTYEDKEYDFSFPRLEYKVSKGHCGFDVKVDGDLEFKIAAKRRDFTINAMGYDIEDKTFLDPFGGINDIKLKKLKHIDDTTFIEDPLRVYRAVQFCSRFDYILADKTFILCKNMVKNRMLDELPKERIYGEFKKLLLKSIKPSIGLNLMKELGILYSFPELEALIGVPQSLKWHPEGDVWIHTLMSVDAMSNLCRLNNISSCSSKKHLKYMLAVLCHDLGKAIDTTVDIDGNIHSTGHEKSGVELTRSLLYRLTEEHEFINAVSLLVEHHMKPLQLYRDRAKSSSVRRLATKVNIEELVLVSKADFLGRTTKESKEGVFYAGDWLLEKSKELKVLTEPLKNLLQGRDLITLGLKPSVKFKTILDDVYTRQLNGEIESKNKALEYVVKRYVKK